MEIIGGGYEHLDLSKNTKLQRLNCSITGIASLDISSNELISYAFNNGEYVTYSYELGEMMLNIKNYLIMLKSYLLY